MNRYVFKTNHRRRGHQPAELSRVSGVRTTTVNKICTKNLSGGIVSPTTKGKITKKLFELFV